MSIRCSTVTTFFPPLSCASFHETTGILTSGSIVGFVSGFAVAVLMKALDFFWCISKVPLNSYVYFVLHVQILELHRMDLTTSTTASWPTLVSWRISARIIPVSFRVSVRRLNSYLCYGSQAGMPMAPSPFSSCWTGPFWARYGLIVGLRQPIL